ncbi:hypothetical protein EMCRGX_G005478 [Ephydatia muelleri]
MGHIPAYTIHISAHIPTNITADITLIPTNITADITLINTNITVILTILITFHISGGMAAHSSIISCITKIHTIDKLIRNIAVS